MEGMGSVRTSSPCSPTTDVPASSNASTFAPRYEHAISPERTGSSGDMPTNAVHTSVPPLTDPSSASCDTASYTHSKPSVGSGAPVEPMRRTRDRSAMAAGATPALRHDSRNGALVPKYVRPASPASRHNAPRSGNAGSPSNSTIAEPTSSPDTSRFHIIQPV